MPRRPPRKWFYACTESVGKDPTVTDPKAVCAWNWYYHMTPTRRRQILRGELFDPEDLAEGSSLFIFDPKRRKRLYRIKVKFKHLSRVWNKLKALTFYTKTPKTRMTKETKVTLIFLTKRAFERAKELLKGKTKHDPEKVYDVIVGFRVMADSREDAREIVKSALDITGEDTWIIEIRER